MLTLSLLLALAQIPTSATRVEDSKIQSISGKVVDKDFTPVAGARVQWGGSPDYAISETLSLTDGTFVVSVTPSREPRWLPFPWFESQLTVEFPGLAKTVVDRLPARQQDVELGTVQVFPFVELRGRVIAGDGTGMAGARLYSERVEGDLVATTDSEGRFSCRNLPSGEVTIGVSAPGFADRLLEPRELTWRKPNELDITLTETSRTVLLSVRSAQTGEPLVATGTYRPGISMGRFGQWPMGGDPFRESRRAFWRLGTLESDTAGVLTVEDVPNGSDPGGVYVEAKGHVRTYFPLGQAETTVKLQELGWIDVRVKRVGSTEPVRIRSTRIGCGQDVRGWSLGWTSRGFGPDNEHVQRLTPDHWRIAWPPDDEVCNPETPGGAQIELEDGAVTRISVAPGEGEKHWTADAIVGATHELRGRVVTAEGQPVRVKLRVSSKDQDDPWRIGHEIFARQEGFLQLETTDEGHFVLPSIGVVRGEFHIETPGWELVDGSAPFYAPAPPPDGYVLTVVPSKPESAPASSPEPAPVRSVVRGVVHVGGAPLGRPLEIGFGPPDSIWSDGMTRLATTWTDAEGRFELKLPKLGYWWVRPRDARQLEKSLRTFNAGFINLKSVTPWGIHIAAPLVEGLQIDFPPLDEWE